MTLGLKYARESSLSQSEKGLISFLASVCVCVCGERESEEKVKERKRERLGDRRGAAAV